MTQGSKLLLVDGDMVAFSCAAAVEYGKEPEDVNFSDIQMAMNGLMKRIVGRTAPTEIIVLISGDTNMRHVICPEYKDNRKDVWRPDNLKNAKATLMVEWNGVKMDGLEADDLMACLARHEYEMDMGKRGLIKQLIHKGPCKYDEVVIASLDKDLRQVGRLVPNGNGPKISHYQWERESLGVGEKVTVVEGFGELKVLIKATGKTTKKEVKGNGPKFFLWQLLVGDPTDGVMGCGVREEKVYKTGAKAGQSYMKRDGVGALEAFELLDKVQNYAQGLQVVATQYLLRFADGWKKELVKNGRLLYMAHTVKDGCKVQLWHYDGKTVEYFDLKTHQIVSA